MDPASAIGLIVNIQQLLLSTYSVGKDMLSAKDDIRKLAVELSALKASLEHVQLVYTFSDHKEDSEDALSILETSNLSSTESKAMLQLTEGILTDLFDRLQLESSRSKKAWQKITWHFEKAELNTCLERLERAKSWFVLVATTDNATLARETYNSICEIDRRLRFQEQRNAEMDNTQLENDIRDWLAPRDSEDYYIQSLDRYQQGTCSWFLDGAFQEWVCGKGQPGLWLKARPGFGKTTLIAAAIDQARKASEASTTNIVVAFWFCSFTEQSAHNVQNILTSLIHQLCCSERSLFLKVDRLYPKKKALASATKRSKLSSKDLIKLFISLVSGVDLTLLVIDALNESENANELVETFNEISRMCSNVRFLVSSTDSTALDVDTSTIHIINANANTNATDIDLYIRSWLLTQEKKLKIPADIKEEILSNVGKNARGVFRWVQCQLQELSTVRTVQAMRDALHKLPRSLEEYYNNVLSRVPEEDCLLARNLLLWVSCAQRLLHLEELCEAVVLPEGKVFDKSMRLLRPHDLLDICPSFINYDHRSNTIWLAHSSVFRFLLHAKTIGPSEREFDLSWNSARHIIAGHCLSYMMLPEFATGYVHRDQIMSHKKAWPLLGYIAHTLWNHLSNIDPSGPIQSLLLEFLDSCKLPRCGNFGAWIQAYNPLMSEDNLLATTPLYWAAREGHLPLVRILLNSEGKKDLESPGGMFASTPLHVASWAGHTEVVRELLLAGADIHETNISGHSGLFWAIALGHKEVEKLLKEANAKVPSTLNGASPELIWENARYLLPW